MALSKKCGDAAAYFIVRLRNCALGVFVSVTSIVLAGCWGPPAGYGTVFRQTNLSRVPDRPDQEAQAIVLDAKQRIIISVPAKNDLRTFGRNDPQRIICAEPSPDVADAISSALSASLNAAVKSSHSSTELNGKLRDRKSVV